MTSPRIYDEAFIQRVCRAYRDYLVANGGDNGAVGTLSARFGVNIGKISKILADAGLRQPEDRSHFRKRSKRGTAPIAGKSIRGH